MIPFDKEKLKLWGVVDFGYTTETSPISIVNYNRWVKESNHLPLSYLEGERMMKRQDLKAYWPGFESAVVFLFSYQAAHLKLKSFYENAPSWNGLKLASYTMGFEGQDYHQKIYNTLVEIAEYLKTMYGPDDSFEFKVCLDIQPVLERDLAYRAGLGWFGKNSMLINRHQGSFFIIGSLLLNKKLIDEERFQEPFLELDHCGECTRCVDACPTEAIDAKNRTIKAIDCISTFTIEQFRPDSLISEKMTLKDGFIFGCDICQDVCPWNKRADKVNSIESLAFSHEGENKIIDLFLKTEVSELREKLSLFSEGSFRRLFKNSSFERSGRRGFFKNLIFYLKDLKKN